MREKTRLIAAKLTVAEKEKVSRLCHGRFISISDLIRGLVLKEVEKWEKAQKQGEK